MPEHTKKTDRVRTLRQPVEQIWLAGLGALSLTEAEGSRLFRSLVKRGQGFEKDTRAFLGDVVTATRTAPSRALTRVETGMTDSVSGVLRRLGVPSQREINSLARRIEGLASTLERQSARPRHGAKRTRHATTKRRGESGTSTTVS